MAANPRIKILDCQSIGGEACTDHDSMTSDEWWKSEIAGQPGLIEDAPTAIKLQDEVLATAVLALETEQAQVARIGRTLNLSSDEAYHKLGQLKGVNIKGEGGDF